MKFYYPLKPTRITIDSSILNRCENDNNFIAQIKKNGWRVQIHKDGDKIEFYSRHNKRMEPMIEDCNWNLLRELVLNNIKKDSVIIDGEMMHRRGELKSTIFIWDMFEMDGKALRFSYKERKDILESIIIPNSNIILIENVREGFKDLYYNLKNPEENEGIVIKDIREPLFISYNKLSNDHSPKQFKLLLSDRRNDENP